MCTAALKRGLLAMMVLLCSCRVGSDQDSPRSAAPAALQPESASMSVIDESSELQSKRPAVNEESSAQLLAHLGYQDRKLAETFYAPFQGYAFEFNNPKELQWMIRNGYPLPKEISEAARLSDAELQAKFEAGDFKSGVFLLERMAVQTSGQVSADGRKLAERLVASGRPFSGYAYYRYFREFKGRWADALAGLLFAYQQGDWRAGELYMRVSQTGGPHHEDLGAGSVGLAYVALLTRMRLMNPAACSRPIDPLIVLANDKN